MDRWFTHSLTPGLGMPAAWGGEGVSSSSSSAGPSVGMACSIYLFIYILYLLVFGLFCMYGLVIADH